MIVLFWSQNRIVQEFPRNMVYGLPVRDYFISACDSPKILEVYGVLHCTQSDILQSESIQTAGTVHIDYLYLL